jgi:hypothetical protein
MGVATKLPSAKVDGGRVVVAEGMTVAVFDGNGVTTSRVGKGVGEATGGSDNVPVGSGDDGVNPFGKTNNTTLIAMTAMANNPREYRKSFQRSGFLWFKELSVE